MAVLFAQFMLTSHLKGKRLVVNVDVSNSCFWHENNLSELARGLSGEKLKEVFQSIGSKQSDGRDPVLMPMLKRLCRNKFVVQHHGSDGELNHVPSLRTQYC